MRNDFFTKRPDASPTIYVYKLVDVPDHEGYIKIGYTKRDVKTRIQEQVGTSGVKYELLYKEPSMRNDGTCFRDKDVHRILKRKEFGTLNSQNNEWYNCAVGDVKAAITELKTGIQTDSGRTETFKMRPEQERAVDRTEKYFREFAKTENRKPKFLWNAKMRFGKTFAAYQLAKRMGLKRILILTFKPAVESAWREDLMHHVDFQDWQFVSNNEAKFNAKKLDKQYEACNKTQPIVVFGSFQDLLGLKDNGGIKAKNEFIHATQWDLVIFDEYHFGAWRDSAQKLFEEFKKDEEERVDFDIEEYQREESGNAYNESFLPITTNYYLYLSGTPFRALNSGEFIEEQIFSWTYSDEQKAKKDWNSADGENPYSMMPQMVLMTYKMPDDIRQIAEQGEFNEFDLNEFFKAAPEEENKPETSRFFHENEVQKWLDLIRGAHLPAKVDDLKLGEDNRPRMPFSNTSLLRNLSHTLWFLPNVASCFAMKNLLEQRQNCFYHDYEINVCAGQKAGIGMDALKPVLQSMGNPLETKSITLTCGKLTTGVTVKPWSGVFMLRNLTSPETYFQTAFRVQSPWTIKDEEDNEINLKPTCYVFDFALDRALCLVSDYSSQLNINEGNQEEKVAEFIHFLPVLAYDGSVMKLVSAQDVLDLAMTGTSSTLLARRWESALLVNVDNDTLRRLLDNEEAMKALMSIEGFRSLNRDIETIINKSESVKKLKKESQEKLTEEQKNELTDEEKEYKSLRKKIQEKLIKFATRVPIFLYLTDRREESLKDVIEQLEPELFKKVTGLDVNDFRLLCSLDVFNSSLMNPAIFHFRRYEDSSLSYTGIDKHAEENIGGWDTTIKREEYEMVYYNRSTDTSEK